MGKGFSAGQAFAVGAVVALVSGLVFVLAGGNVWLSLGGALFFALVMGKARYRQWGSTVLNGLTRDQRRQLSRAVRRGEPVEDPKSATALLAYAKVVRTIPTSTRTPFVFALLMGAACVVISLSVGNWDKGLVVGVLIIGLALFAQFVLNPLSERRRDRFNQAVWATEDRFDGATMEKWSQSTRD